ncbi:MAG TPA: hypothetical protein DD811_04260 [Syntrophomonas sp.]|nr:hypothetical protein [Syntrophomonas sp.]
MHPKLAEAIPGTGFLAQTVELGLTIAAGVLIYVLGLTLLRSREARYGWVLLHKAARKITGTKVS